MDEEVKDQINTNFLEDHDKDHARDNHVGFVRKVLGIVSAQMMITFLCAIASSYNPDVGAFFRSPITQIVSLVILCPAMCTLFFVHK